MSKITEKRRTSSKDKKSRASQVFSQRLDLLDEVKKSISDLSSRGKYECLSNNLWLDIL